MNYPNKNSCVCCLLTQTSRYINSEKTDTFRYSHFIMRAVNVLPIFLVLIAGAIVTGNSFEIFFKRKLKINLLFLVQSGLLCDRNACRQDCVVNHGATGGICQSDRTGGQSCMCSYNPIDPSLPCEPNVCKNNCIINSAATGGICQVDRDQVKRCICSYT